MIDVEQRALRALEQNRRAPDDGAMDLEPYVRGEREQPVSELLENSKGVIDIGALGAGHGQLDVGVCDSALDQLSQTLRIPQVEHADPAPSVLILVRWTNSTARGADLLARGALAVDQLVIGQHEVSAIAHIEAAFDVDAIGHQLVYLGEECLDIENDAVADRAAHAGVQNPAPKLVEHERLFADVHGVAGVGTTLIPDYPVGALGENIDELA